MIKLALSAAFVLASTVAYAAPSADVGTLERNPRPFVLEQAQTSSYVEVYAGGFEATERRGNQSGLRGARLSA